MREGTAELLGAPGRQPAALRSQRQHLIVVYHTGTAFVWDMDPDRWKQEACAVGRPLSREEWKKLLPDRCFQPACQ
jgi:hypothetical protein